MASHSHISASVVGLFFLIVAALMTPAEGYVYGWSSTTRNDTSFKPGREFEFSLQTNGSDLAITLDPSLKGELVNVSLCNNASCTIIYYHRAFPSSPTAPATYSLQNIVPPFKSLVLVVQTKVWNESLSSNFPLEAAGTFNFSAQVNEKGLSLSWTDIGYLCIYTTPAQKNMRITATAVAPTTLRGDWKCIIPDSFVAPAYPEYTPFVMQVEQLSGTNPVTRPLPSLSGEVVFLTGAVVGSVVLAGCAGSNIIFKGQFSMKNRYACMISPINSTPWMDPKDAHTVFCVIPSVNQPTKITSLTLLEARPGVTTWVYVNNDVDRLPTIRSCTGDGNDDDDDDGFPLWASVLLGLGATCLVALVFLVVVFWFIRRTKRAYTTLGDTGS